MLEAWQGHDAAWWQRTWSAGDVQFFESTSSTNDVVAEMAEAGAPNLSLALAEEQTQGRGRGGASWQAARGDALLFSVLFRIGEQGVAPGCAPIRIGLAVAESIDALVKWPNDVVYKNHGKVAGVLCEGAFGQQRGYIVAGIGVNVLQEAADFPAELHACSVLSATGRNLDRGTLLTDIMARLGDVANVLTDPLTGSELQRFAARDVLLNQEVTCETVTGVARGLQKDGALLIGERAVYNGTVRLAGTHAYPGAAR